MQIENQHWVPKFLIKCFADRDGRVFRLDIQKDEVTKPPPKHAACEMGFNEFKIGTKLVSFEDRLERIETRAAPVLKSVLKRRSLARLTADDRERIADFMAAQSFRTKAFQEGMVGDPDRETLAAILERMWQSAFITVNAILQRYWVLMVIETEEVFYLGDNPVVLQRTEKPTDGGNLGFDVKGVEAFLPLSPKCALYMPCHSTGEDIIGGYQAASTMHRTVRSAVLRGVVGGTKELELSQRVMRTSYPLYVAITTGQPLTAMTPNIENLNYLQCSWAHTAIYSIRRDFTFARRVFTENPQYRAVPKTSLMDPSAVTRGHR